jgi:hypothetical protein
MKKLILLAAILLTAGTVSAQTYFNGARADYNEYYESKFGFELSGNMSNATRGPNFRTFDVAGFSAGINVVIPVVYPISVMPALLYSQKGFSATTPSGYYTQRTQSIDAPILAEFSTGKSVSFYLGPQVSYIISNSSKFSDNFSPTTRSTYQNPGNLFRLQGVAGIGVDVSTSLSLHARYILDINRNAQNNGGLMPTYRTQSWQVGFGINI